MKSDAYSTSDAHAPYSKLRPACPRRPCPGLSVARPFVSAPSLYCLTLAAAPWDCRLKTLRYRHQGRRRTSAMCCAGSLTDCASLLR
jgi:hypothetical protein